MRDNPLHVAALGENPTVREQALAAVFRAFLAMQVATKGLVVGAYKHGSLVGV